MDQIRDIEKINYYKYFSFPIIIVMILIAQMSCVFGNEETINFDQNSTISLVDCSRIAWYPDLSDGHNSPPALHSGPIRNSGQSCIKKKVEGPASISFFWKVYSSRDRIGELSFNVDNETILICSSSEWSPVYYAISPGMHNLSWVYKKQHSYPEFEGAGWIDDLKIVSYDVHGFDSNSLNLPSNLFTQELKQNLDRINDSLSAIEMDVRRSDGNMRIINGSIEKVNRQISEANLSKIKSDIAYLIRFINETNATNDFNKINYIYNQINDSSFNLDRINESLSAIEMDVRRSDGNMRIINGSIENVNRQISEANLSKIKSDIAYLIRFINETNATNDFNKINYIYNQINDSSFNYSVSSPLAWISDNVVYVSDSNSNLSDIIHKNIGKIIILNDGVYHVGADGLKIESDGVCLRSIRKWGAKIDGDNATECILLDTVNNVTLDSLVIFNCTTGIHIENSTHCEIINNNLIGFKDIGIVALNTTQCLFTYNNINPYYDHKRIGIQLMNSSNDNKLLFNDIYLNRNDETSWLYNIKLSEDNVIYVSDDGWVRENGVTCFIKNSEKFNCSWSRNGTLLNFEPRSKNMWEFLDE